MRPPEYQAASGNGRDAPAMSNPNAYAIAPRLPVLFMVLAATAIPIEWRSPAGTPLSWDVDSWDVVENVAGYVPIGAVLVGIGSFRAIAAAALVSTFAESMQLAMMQRDSSLIDVATNVVGAIIGVIVTRPIWPMDLPNIRLTGWGGLAAGALTLALVLRVWAISGAPLNDRGLTTPGILEAHWKLDEQGGRIARDSSGRGLDATFTGAPARVPGKLGGAVRLDGVNDYIDAGRASAFRLIGSMTVSAWIRPSSFPIDDGAIASSFENTPGATLGWQLDTTIDRGPGPIGFKVGDACTKLTARYGATRLVANTWYHVAAVFDAQTRKMDVYLNGVLDNGPLVGTVTQMRRSSRMPLFIGRRSDIKGNEFIGTLDDVQVYSFALSANEIIGSMNGRPVSRDKAVASSVGVAQDNDRASSGCTWVSERADGRLPATVAVVGVLTAVLCLALLPGRIAIAVLASGLAGLVIFAVSRAALPRFNLWMFPLTSASGAIAVALSLRSPARNP